ncbi:MAG: sulfatase-like hydrolase/transferase [Rickettsiales bacterium]|nr:sulfatase-like hydrolase/transferase [Rickettsiales bacterium]
MFGEINYNILFDILSFLSLIVLLFFVGSDKKYKNFLIAFCISVIVILEMLSISFIRRSLDEYFLFFLMNIEIFHLAIATKIMFLYYSILFFIISLIISYLILKKIHIKKFRKFITTICLLILILPNGFIYDIFHVLLIEYGMSYYNFKDKTYQEIFKSVKGQDYITKDNLKVFKSKEKYKNLVLIYLESFDQSFLTDDYVKGYSKNLQNLALKNKFYNNMEQLKGCWGTVPGIICTQCGVQFNSYFLIDNPYRNINNTQLVCVSDILNKAKYKQVFIGGAEKKLFNKGNYLLSHEYDVVEDKNSLVGKNPLLKNELVDWGVADYDVFDIAKKEYVKLSKKNKPFNLTILTTSTHSPTGIYDKRCKNSTNSKILNAVECDDFLVQDFVKFLKKQKNFENTLVVILPDHIQFSMSSLNRLVDQNKEKLYFIILNGNKSKIDISNIDYTNLPNILLKELNIKSNANFLNNEKDETLIKNFMYKIHKKIIN